MVLLHRSSVSLLAFGNDQLPENRGVLIYELPNINTYILTLDLVHLFSLLFKDFYCICPCVYQLL